MLDYKSTSTHSNYIYMYEIGFITTTHGIKGELKIKDLSDFNRFKVEEEFYVIYNNLKQPLTVETIREHKGALIIKFMEFNNINDVLKFKDHVIYSDTQGELAKGEYYFQDLINLKAYTVDDLYIGVVTEVLEMPNGHILEIMLEDKKTLIPFRKEFIQSVTDDKVIIIPLEGLI